MSGVRILIVYASQSGGTARLAEAAKAGAAAEDAEVRALHGTQAGVDDLLWCDGLVVATPENFGYMAGAVKDFFDRTYDAVRALRVHLPYVLMVRAGNDGTFACAAVERIVRGYGFDRVAEPLIALGELTESHLERAHELGQTLAAGSAFGVFGRKLGARDGSTRE